MDHLAGAPGERGTEAEASTVGVVERARDEVKGAATTVAKAARPVLAPTESPPGRRDPVRAVVLTVLLEGLGQVYNGQPRKGAAFFVVGKALSVASGLVTWLLRRVFRREQAKLGPDRVRPGLAALWAASFGLCLWDAWKHAASPGNVRDRPER